MRLSEEQVKGEGMHSLTGRHVLGEHLSYKYFIKS